MSDYLQFGSPIYTLNWAMGYSVLNDSVLWVNGDYGSDGQSGKSPRKAMKSIQYALDRTAPGGTVFVMPRKITALATDPVSYAETLIIDNEQSNVSLIGISTGLTQGGLPQIAKGSGATHLLDVRAPGCVIANLGFNGASMTTDGGASGIYLNDDGGTTYSCFGTTIKDCHFKNLGRGHTNAAAAICIGSNGGAWQLRIEGNRFYKCLGGISLLGTSVSVPQDIVISGNWFGSAANTDTDCDIDLGNGSGATGIVIDGNTFATVDVPSHASGSVGRYVDLTSCKGILSNNTFACIVAEGDTELTFGAAGTGGLVPTTVRMAGNTGESQTGGASQDFGSVFRT